MSNEMPEFEPGDTEGVMKWAKDKGLENAKTVGVLASEAWNALEEGNYARASLAYSTLSTMTNHLSLSTFAMARQDIIDETSKTT